MRIFLHSTRAEASPSYIVTVAPAADDFVKSEHAIADWKTPEGNPKQIEVVFQYGAAEVPDALGKYIVSRGIAQKTRLVRQVRQLFDAAGRVIHGGVFDEHGAPVALAGDASDAT